MRDELLEIWEAAERLGVTQGMLNAWITKRRVTVVKFGAGNGAVRVRASEVERLISQGTILARPAAGGSSSCLNKKSDRQGGQPS